MKQGLLAITLLILCPAAAAAEPAAPDLGALAERADKLSQDSVELGRDILLLEDSLIPNRRRVAVFLTADKDAPLSIAAVDLAFDGGAPTRHEFSESQAKALREGGAARLHLSAMPEGSHSLTATLLARDADGAVHSLKHTVDFAAGRGSRAIELRLTGRNQADAGLVSPAEGEHDLYYKEVLYHQSLSDPVTAMAHLQAAQRRHHLQLDLGASDLAVARLYEAMGMPLQASDHYARIVGGGRVASVRAEALYHLAEDSYRRGDYARADEYLARTGSALPKQFAERLPFLHALVLMEAGRTQEASKRLSSWQTPNHRDAWTRYNLGVAELRLGRLQEGGGMLDSVGVMKADTDEMLTLRDQANLALAYGFMRADQGATARPLFQRVRLDGRSSNRALLGLGWSELAPDGKRQVNLNLAPIGCVEDPTRILPSTMPALRRLPRDACDREKVFKQRVYFAMSPAATSEPERYRRALKPWLTLVQRDPADPAVQESLLATGFAFSRLQAHDQAIEHYRRAVAIYEVERQHLDRAIEAVRNGPINPEAEVSASPAGMPWRDRVWQLPREQDARYLDELLASHKLTSALRDYRDLLRLSGALHASATRLQLAAGKLETAPAPAVPAPVETASASDAPIEFGFQNVLGVNPSSPPPPAESEELPRQREKYSLLQSQLSVLQGEVRTAIASQEQAIRALAVIELTRYRTGIDTYLAQARFSLARLLDPATRQGGQ